MTELAQEMGVASVYAVANKVRNQEDADALRAFCEQRELNLVATVPEDEAIKSADRLGVAPLDHEPSGAAVQAIDGVARMFHDRA